MSPAIEVLLLFTAWTLLLAVGYVGYRVVLVLTFKEKANAWTRNAATHQDPVLITRLSHAHLNCLENLPVFAAVVLAAYMLGNLSAIEGLAWVYLGARIFQSVVHLISTSPLFVFLRANGLLVQWIVLGIWIVTLLR